jgi:hypothetical protein
MSKVILTLTDVATEKDVINAVRRAFSGEVNLTVGAVNTVKGVKVRVKEAANTRPNLLHVRAWAAKKGIVLGKRGRIPATVLAAYEKAHTAR